MALWIGERWSSALVLGVHQRPQRRDPVCTAGEVELGCGRMASMSLGRAGLSDGRCTRTASRSSPRLTSRFRFRLPSRSRRYRRGIVHRVTSTFHRLRHHCPPAATAAARVVHTRYGTP